VFLKNKKFIHLRSKHTFELNVPGHDVPMKMIALSSSSSLGRLHILTLRGIDLQLIPVSAFQIERKLIGGSYVDRPVIWISVSPLSCIRKLRIS